MAGEDSCLAVTPLRLITHTVEFRGDAARIRQRVVVLSGTAETLVMATEKSTVAPTLVRTESISATYG